jgi:hypothetical protein
VVADGRDVEVHLVEDVDGRLVLRDERLEGRGTDQVAGRGEDRVGVLGPQRLDGTGVLRGAGDVTVGQEPAVEVVGAQDLDLDLTSHVRKNQHPPG